MQDDNEKDLLAVIDQIPDWRGKAVEYTPVVGGITNPNWKVSVEGRAFFVKIPGRGTEAFIDRKNAHIASRIAQDLGIGARMCYSLEASGVEVFEWLEGYRGLNFGDVFSGEIFYKIIDTIRKFHRYQNEALPLTQTPFEETYKYFRLARELGGYLPPEMERMEWMAHQIEAAVMVAGIPLVPCHNDFWTANFMLHTGSGQLKLIDYEYASMGDECYDFADISGTNYFTEAMDNEWIRYYYAGFNEEKFARMKLYKMLKDIGWSMWSLVQAKQSSVQNYDYYEWFGTKMCRLRQLWVDPRIDYWLNLLKGKPIF